MEPVERRARICKLLISPRIDSEESMPPGWESIPGLLKRFTNTGSVSHGKYIREIFSRGSVFYLYFRITNCVPVAELFRKLHVRPWC